MSIKLIFFIFARQKILSILKLSNPLKNRKKYWKYATALFYYIVRAIRNESS